MGNGRGPLGEEPGWRGYALPRLEVALGPVRGSLFLALLWAGWHLPLFWIPGTAQSHLPLALFLVRTVGLSVISTWIYNGTRRMYEEAGFTHVYVHQIGDNQDEFAEFAAARTDVLTSSTC